MVFRRRLRGPDGVVRSAVGDVEFTALMKEMMAEFGNDIWVILPIEPVNTQACNAGKEVNDGNRGRTRRD